MTKLRVVVAAALGLSFLAVPVFAQGTIAGTVRDESGAVLPGVTVQVASPALIEGSREAVSDASGLYSITNLRPGTYTVTFALTGFATTVRPNVVIEASFAAQVNADLKLSSLQETITVTGEAPIVDVRSSGQQQVLTREILDELPAARVVDRQAAMLPGVLNVVPAGGAVTGSGTARTSLHGSDFNDSKWLLNGLPIVLGTSAGGSQQALNDAGFEQVSVDDGGGSAESSLSGARFNIIPKEGGNTVSGLFWGSWGPGWQADNLSPELRAAGVGNTAKIDFDFDLGPAIGGPILQNRVWYFAAYRQKGTQQTLFNTFYSDGVPVQSRNGWYKTATGRLTFQATRRDKISFSYEGNGSRPGSGRDGNGNCSGASPSTAAEACTITMVKYASQASMRWTSTPTNRLLLEAALQKSTNDQTHNRYRDEVGAFDVSLFDSGTGRRIAAPAGTSINPNKSWVDAYAATASYVTGSHSFKAGMSLVRGENQTTRNPHGDISQLTFVNGVPNAVVVMNTPFTSVARMDADLGLFAQDSWTLRRVTLNVGYRWNYLNESIPAASAPAGLFVPAREFAGVKDIPKWNDHMPRFGASWDVFGTGRTALKGTVGRYVAQEALDLINTFNPLSSQTDSRAWTDLDGNRSIFAAGTFNVQRNEIGPSRNNNFGLAAGVPRLDPDLKRGYNWSYAISVQHELLPAVSVSLGYYRRDFHNLGQTVNRAVDRDRDFTPFTIVGPRHPNLPNGGGETITLYNLVPAKLGAVDNVVTYSSVNSRQYDGYELNMNGRLLRGATVFGGITMGRTRANTCDVANPNDRRFCNSEPPFQGIYKLGWNMPLPYDFAVNGTFQAIPGLPREANYAVTSAIAGVPLTGGGTLTVRLVDPAREYLDMVKTMDVRVTRMFSLGGRRRAKAFVDFVNAINDSTVLSVSNTFGSTWLRPQAATSGRYVRLGTQVDF